VGTTYIVELSKNGKNKVLFRHETLELEIWQKKKNNSSGLFQTQSNAAKCLPMMTIDVFIS